MPGLLTEDAVNTSVSLMLATPLPATPALKAKIVSYFYGFLKRGK
jgi:hypothetical protein